MSRSSGLWFPLIAVSIVLTGFTSETRLARAQPSGSVSIVLVGPRRDLDRIEGLLRDLVGGPEARVAFDRARSVDYGALLEANAAPSTAAAHVWVDLTDRSRATLLLVDRSWRRAVIRRVPTPDGSSPVSREEIGQIVAASIEAMQAGSPLGLDRADAARVLREDVDGLLPTEPVSTVRDLSLSLGLGWSMHVWHFENSPQQGALIFGAIELGTAPRHRIELGTAYLLPRTVGTEFVSAQLHGPAVRVDWSLYLLSGPLSLRTGIGAGVDILFTQSRVGEGSAYAAEPRKVGIFPMARGLLGAGWNLGSVSLDLTAGVDLDLRNADYYQRQGTVEVSVFDPNRLRPYVSLRLAFDVLGAEEAQ